MNIGIVFITGQSKTDSCELSPIQKEFGERLALEGANVFELNFPYRNMKPYEKVSIVRASVSNIAIYFRSRKNTFKKNYLKDVLALFSRYDKIMFLAGSCGLELLNNLDIDVSRKRIHILAYGPVARQRSKYSCTYVLGKQDYISRCLFFGNTFLMSLRSKNGEVGNYPNYYSLACGHMDYLANPDFFEIAKTCLKELKKIELSE